jgi:hypothetical protein
VPNSSSAPPGPSTEPTEPGTTESPVASVASVAVAEPGEEVAVADPEAAASSSAGVAAAEAAAGAADGETATATDPTPAPTTDADATAKAADIDVPLDDAAAAAPPSAAGPLSEPLTEPDEGKPGGPAPAPGPGPAPAAPPPAEESDDHGEGSGAHRATPRRWRSLRWRPGPRSAGASGQHARTESRFRVSTFFRVPATDDPTPDNGQLVGICAWATALGLAGLLIAIRGLVSIIGGYTASWYEPALVSVGMVGIVLTVLAFMAIQRRYLPWIMLGAATVALGVNIGLTFAAV